MIYKEFGLSVGPNLVVKDSPLFVGCEFEIENILDHNDCKLFIQTYDTEEARMMIDKISPYVTIIEPNIPDFTIPESVYNHKAPETSIENMYWMYRNIKRCNQLFTPDEPFDAVLRTRFDLIYPEPLDLSTLSLDKLWIPARGDWGGGIFDMVAYGTHEKMNHYASLFDHIESYNNDGVLAHPETLLRHHLRDMDVGRFEYPIHVIRPDCLWLATV